MKAQLLSLRAWNFEFPNFSSLRLVPRFWTYSPKVNLDIKTQKYHLKTADSLDELLEVFKLRHDIFLGHQERSESYDTDEFDHVCDHIIIRDIETDKICGTYRILCSEYVEKFYSESEFILERFLEQDGVKVELGRACIHHAHRNGAVIDLLWKGISKYCQKVNASFLFGCSSIHTNELSDMKALDAFIKSEDLYSDFYEVRSYGEFEVMEAELVDAQQVDLAEGKKRLPPLLRSYLNAGAKIYGTPAYDEDFGCFDYLTILEMKNVSNSFKRRYFTHL